MVGDSLPEAYLVVTTETGQREVHRIDRSSMTLGRGADSDLVLTNPRVSRRHARLTWDGAQFLLQDLGSKNGTRINGTPVSEPAPIADGDMVYIETRRGVIMQKANVTDIIHPKVINVESNWWFPEQPAQEPWLHGLWQSNANVLTMDDADACDRLSGGPAMSALLCKVYKVKTP